MTRVRVSTTVDQQLLSDARRASGDQPDSALLDSALRSFLLTHRAAELDAQYDAYDNQPLETPDEWGDLVVRRGFSEDGSGSFDLGHDVVDGVGPDERLGVVVPV